MNLIILSELTCNEGLYFRFLTMMAKTELEYDVLVEAEKNKIDHYYKKLKRHGWHDFVDDFVQPEWKIEGVRIDTELNYPRTIRTDSISCMNVPSLLGQIKSIRKVQI